MQSYLRKIDLARWSDENLYIDFKWREKTFWRELSSDVLADLKTHNRALSIWQLEPKEENLQRVLASLCTYGDKVIDFSYLKFSEDDFRSCNIKLSKSKGETKDAIANDTWHFDLVDLTARDLLRLARFVAKRTERGEIKTIFRRENIDHLALALDKGWQKKTDLKLSKKELSFIETAETKLRQTGQ